MEKNKEISKQFYKTAKVWTPLSFESIPAYEYIQHGTMHRIVEDEDNEGFNFSWLIEKK